VPQNKLSDQFKPLGLTNAEIDQLTAFVENGLYDDNLQRDVPAGQCFPNADAQAREVMGCN